MALKSLKKVVTPAKAPEPEPEPDKQALKKVTVLLTARQWRQVKEFALDESTTLQALVVKGLAAEMARKGITLDEA
jgi:hypothetical protein